ncbi:MAG: hypothetical protein QG567_276 [Campylobacterota bacterium]|nr:hypothetical protein [Campylobacterota bacterium]
MKKMLLTGSNGFVGNYFVDKYSSKYEIQKFSFLHDDFNLLDLKMVNVVFHLSALVHQMGGASADEYERVNVTQTLDLATKAKASGVRHFIFMSTVKVYGEETNVGLLRSARNDSYTENSVCHPEDEYGKSKLRAENKLLELETNDFKISIIRTPIIYGYGAKANIKNLISLVQKVPILPFGGIKNKRSMVYVGNLCHLVDEVIGFRIKYAMTEDSYRELDSGSRNIFLASDDEPLSTTRLVELIAKELNKKVYLIKMPFFETILKLLKPSFYKRLYGSLEVDSRITKVKLNLKNTYSVEYGIKFMIHGEK